MMHTTQPRTCGDDVEELYFGRGDSGVSVRVSHDGTAPVLMVAGTTTYLSPLQAAVIGTALIEAGEISERLAGR
jgi:hypothetical protein